WRDFPSVPTVNEHAIPGFEVMSWTGLAGPARMPPAIVERLNAELRRAIAVPEVKSKLEAMGGDARATTPAEMRALVASQFATGITVAGGASLRLDCGPVVPLAPPLPWRALAGGGGEGRRALARGGGVTSMKQPRLMRRRGSIPPPRRASLGDLPPPGGGGLV